MYTIQYDPRVVKEDFKSIPKNELKKIVNVIEKKLTHAPDQYGKPLKGTLKNYWKLKIGNYRVVYQIEKDKVIVTIIHIGQRKDDLVYQEAYKRVLI